MEKLVLICIAMALFGCKSEQKEQSRIMKSDTQIAPGKKVVYQVFTRLFGNTNTTNKPWGTMEENGVGKFADFTETALKEIKDLGVTHIWYTGVPHHDIISDYTAFGISNDDPDIVKGRAGSPYAVKDYYNVNPDLATDPGTMVDVATGGPTMAAMNALKTWVRQNSSVIRNEQMRDDIARRLFSVDQREQQALLRQIGAPARVRSLNDIPLNIGGAIAGGELVPSLSN